MLFIDASADFEEGSNQNRLRVQDIHHISGTFRAYAEVEKYARVVLLAEIEQNDWNLNISQYVDTSDGRLPDLGTVMKVAGQSTAVLF